MESEGRRIDMHDIWNPWHGCEKFSEGCLNCYMYYLDAFNEKSGKDFYVTRNLDYPLMKDRHGNYRIKSGEMIRVCMTSDFFYEKADPYRQHCFDIMKKRRDVVFYFLTKRANRIKECLPPDIASFENIFMNVTCENQKRADERIPILLSLPFCHKGLFLAPMLEEITIEKYLRTGQIEQVILGGENYGGRRPCDFAWVKKIREECFRNNVSFCFIETGTVFIKDGKKYVIEDKKVQSEMAFLSKQSFKGKKIQFNLYDERGNRIPPKRLYQRTFRESCRTCGSQWICNGCSNCGKCE